ncbi:MAG: HTH domain-containing protein, partial [Treponema sp.]|nr:HTH domain-containing protein [Treponema sp.]
ELMRKDSMITAVEIASALKLSKRAVDKQIQKLRETNKIRRVGPDKGGHWEIITVTDGDKAGEE